MPRMLEVYRVHWSESSGNARMENGRKTDGHRQSCCGWTRVCPQGSRWRVDGHGLLAERYQWISCVGLLIYRVLLADFHAGLASGGRDGGLAAEGCEEYRGAVTGNLISPGSSVAATGGGVGDWTAASDRAIFLVDSGRLVV